MQLSVIILNYKVPYFLKLCLDSVSKAIQNLEAEIIVIDNHSEDESCEMVKNDFPEVLLIENKENFGFPKGNNIGVEQAKGKYICVLNPDTVVGENTFELLIKSYEKNENCGILGCKLIDGSGNFLPESKRGVPTPWVAFTKFFGLYQLFPNLKIFNQYYVNALKENEVGKVEILVGALMLMEKKLYQELNGFDENCFMYADDIDLSYRALQIGKQNYYDGTITVIHYKGESTNKDITYMKRFAEAMNYFYAKHFKKSYLFTIFMKIGIMVFSFLKKNKKSYFRPKINEYYFVSNEMKAEFKQKFNSIEVINSFETLKIKPNTEIIFDANFMSYQSIIEGFNLYKNKFTFKILPQNSSYIIGSNTSEDKGEVVFV